MGGCYKFLVNYYGAQSKNKIHPGCAKSHIHSDQEIHTHHDRHVRTNSYNSFIGYIFFEMTYIPNKS